MQKNPEKLNPLRNVSFLGHKKAKPSLCLGLGMNGFSSLDFLYKRTLSFVQESIAFFVSSV